MIRPVLQCGTLRLVTSQLCLLQVVTGCDSSSIAVWDIETGNKSIVFSNAHGEEEITVMGFDESWRRLMTGARNGTIKVKLLHKQMGC